MESSVTEDSESAELSESVGGGAIFGAPIVGLTGGHSFARTIANGFRRAAFLPGIVCLPLASPFAPPV